MRWTHLLGVAFVLGLTCIGVIVAAASFRWSEIAYPAGNLAGSAPGAQSPSAPMPPEAAQGQTVFKAQCSSCHTIGGGRKIGPDLKGVTKQRPRDWLVNFITAPDKLLKTDPTAQQLLKEYNVPMPNLGITQQQATQILAYIDFESGSATPAPAVAAQPTGVAPGQGVQATSAPAATTPPGAAPVTADPAKGKAAFDQMCSTCHTIGGGKKVGPDLKGVTSKQSHDWLVHMITEPDKWTQTDPTAKQLKQQYGIQMPTLGVSQGTANDIIAYIQQQSGGAVAPSVPGTSHPLTRGGQGSEAAAAPAAATFRQLSVHLEPLLPQAAGNPQQGETIFKQKCASCHTVGGGKSVGPDLKGVTQQRSHDWLVNMITQPDKWTSSDPTAQQLLKQYGVPMPNLGVSQAQADDVIAYIQQQSGGQPPPGGQPAPQTQPGDAQNGRALFTGENRLSSGGPACIGCHNATGIGTFGGGTWGLDLTKEQSKVGNNGIVSTLKAPPFPGMQQAFAGHTLTDKEIADLAAFFAEEDKQQPGMNPGIFFPLVGLLACAVMLAIAAVPWLGRTRGVRKPLVGGAAR